MAAGTYRQKPVNKEPDTEQAPSRWFKINGSPDLLLALTMVLFVVFGLIMVWSASYDFSYNEYGDPNYQIYRQVLWMFLGITTCVTLSTVDYHRLAKFAVPIMLFTIGMLVFVFISGQERLNAVRTLFNGSIQPSELAKLTIVIYLSVWLNSRKDMLHDATWGLIPFGIIIGVLVILILMQPDTSAAITVAILGVLLFYLGGSGLKQFIIVSLVAGVAGYFLLTIFSSTGSSRFESFFNGLKDSKNSADHVIYAFEAIVNGGWFGVGIGNSVGKYTVLPFESTDSIFAVITEELGLLGAMFTVSLYGVIAWRGFKIANRAPDMLGSLLAAGLTVWIVFEAGINMLSLVGWFPFAGNALPFISYGGSSVLMSFIAIGIIFSVSRHSGEQTEAEEWRGFSATFDLRGRNRRRSVSRSSRSERINQDPS